MLGVSLRGPASSLFFAACATGACSSSSTSSTASPMQTPRDSDAATCSPPPESCDAPPPEMHELDPARGCLMAPATVAEICNTSVNPCAPSMGLSTDCAFAPDGRVFIAGTTDNQMYTATGWRFSEPLSSFPQANAIPIDQRSTRADDDRRQALACTPPCPGVKPRAYVICYLDAGSDAPHD